MWSGRSERRRRLQEHDDLRLPTLLFQKVDSVFDDGQHRRVIARELGRPHERHLYADATPFGGDPFRVSGQDRAVDYA